MRVKLGMMSAFGVCFFVGLEALATAQQPQIVVQTGHPGYINCVAFAFDGKVLATGSEDGTIKLWEISTGRELRTLGGSSLGQISSILFTSDDRMLVVGLDSSIAFLDASTGAIGQTIHEKVTSFALSPNDEILASVAVGSKAIKLWDVLSGKSIGTLTSDVGSEAYQDRVFFSRDGKELASVASSVVQIWNPLSRQLLRTISSRGQRILSATFGPDGNILAIGSEAEVALWDITTGNLERAVPIRAPQSAALAFSSDLKLVAAGIPYDTRVWNLVTGSELWTGEERAKEIDTPPELLTPDPAIQSMGAIAVCESLPRLFRLGCTSSGGDGVEIRRFSGTITSNQGKTTTFSGPVAIKPGRGRHEIGSVEVQWRHGPHGYEWREPSIHIRGPTGSVRAAAFSSDGRYLATAKFNSATVWDVVAGKTFQMLTGPVEQTYSLSLSLDGRLLASGTDGGTVDVWDLFDGKGSSFSAHVPNSVDVAFSRNGAALVSADTDGVVKVRDTATLHETSTLPAPPDTLVLAEYLSGDRSKLAMKSKTINPEKQIIHTFNIWDITGGQRRHEINVPSRILEKVDRVVFSQDGKMMATQVARNIHLWDFGSVALDRGLSIATPQEIRSIALSFDGKTLIIGTGEGLIEEFETDSLKRIHTFPECSTRTRAFGKKPCSFEVNTAAITSLTLSPKGNVIASQNSNGDVVLWETTTGKAKVLPRRGERAPLSIMPGGAVLATAGPGPEILLWGVTSGHELGELVISANGSWLVTTADGQFDTNTADDIRGLHWVFGDDPFRALPPNIFMRDYYEPRLLPRLLAGEEMPKLPPLQGLNRVQPTVKIVFVGRGASPDLAQVTVEVSRAEDQFQRDGKPITMKTDVYDLRLFRAGQLVGQEPDPKAEVEESLKNGVELTPEQLQAWRDARRVKLNTVTGKAEKTFVIRLPHGQAGKQIEFTAYAFNEDRVKSETARASYTVPNDAGPMRKRAYVITMGVNTYQRQGWDLHFAASDAKRIQAALSKRLVAYEVVPVTMISDCRTAGCPENGDRSIGEDHATKAALHAVLEKLAGHELSGELTKSVPPGAEKVEKAEPDDLVVLSVSSHGYTSKEGTFYAIPSDSGETEGKQLPPALLEKWVSSDELSGWMRDVDAGDLVMIVDTCHSASTVEEPGFKPGPMGSRGLGQLAYDKGMRILAASQADDVALEVETLKQGLLTYALVENGLEEGQAAGADGKITMEGWLQYGADRVPTLYNEVLAGKVQKFTATSKDTSIDVELSGGNSSLRKPNAFQQPSFFKFQERQSQIVLVDRH